jgi:TPR repeat protein
MVVMVTGLSARITPVDVAGAAEPAPALRQEAQGAAPARNISDANDRVGSADRNGLEKTILDRAPIDKGAVEKGIVEKAAIDPGKTDTNSGNFRGDKAKAVALLVDAAEKGHSLAQWKLGRIYADGDGVQQDKLRAFEYFQRYADKHADDGPDMPQSRLVANAYVALGRYYLEGIPDSPISPNPERAREMFTYAASYFADADAQYQLGRLYFDGVGIPRDARQSVRWLSLAANKGQSEAQGLLGHILFAGDYGLRQRPTGLMWLTLARDGAGRKHPWIGEYHEAAFKQATDTERALALGLIERWLEGRKQ